MSEITRRGAAAAVASLFASSAGAQVFRRAPEEVLPSPWYDATATAEHIRSGQLSARQVTLAAIDRAQAMQPALNFMVTSDFDRALATAQQTPRGPFGGVPFLVKDLDDFIGVPTRMGSASRLRSPAATTEGPLVEAFRRAGLVTLGKSATPEWGFLPTTEPPIYGPTRNPWSPHYSSGGSSGGAAAAVAAGVVPIAHASDGGGSIRIPASCCGVFGLKPSRGRMVGSEQQLKVTDLSVDHVLTRSVRDSAAAFAAFENTAPGAPLKPVGFVKGPGRRRLNVGLIFEGMGGAPPHPEVFEATQRTAALLKHLGHSVTPTRWPVGPSFTEDFLLLWASGAAELAAGIAKAAPGVRREALLEPFTLGMADMFGRAPEGALEGAIERLNVASMAYTPWFAASGFDVVLSPVLATPPPPLGHLAPTVPFRTLVERLIAYVGYTTYHNVAGAPAKSVPLQWSSTGLPIGSQFAARPGDEAVLFELAYELERAQPWSQRLPWVRADRALLPVRSKANV